MLCGAFPLSPDILYFASSAHFQVWNFAWFCFSAAFEISLPWTLRPDKIIGKYIFVKVWMLFGVWLGSLLNEEALIAIRSTECQTTRPQQSVISGLENANIPSRHEQHEGICSFTLTVFLRQNVINNVKHVVLKIIWLIFSFGSWAEVKNLQRLGKAHFLVSQLRCSISRVLCAPTFKRIDFKPEGNLHWSFWSSNTLHLRSHNFWLHLNWAN